jgi:hypothetical protein
VSAVEAPACGTVRLGGGDAEGGMEGDVTVYYDPDDHNVEIYGVSNRQLTEKYWNASNGAWTGWNSL